MNDRIPVTIVSGALGAGKTTLLNHLLSNNEGREIAVLVNDMGEINVDAELLETGSELDPAAGVAELSNGCICCERQDDLETEVTRLAADRDFEYLVVEASGISEPAPIARLFTTEARAAALYEVDTTVTVVDGRVFHDTFAGDGTPVRETAPGDEERPLSDLLIEQVEFCDVLVCNKTDLLSSAERDRVTALVEALSPTASLVQTTFGEVDPEVVLGTGRFDPLEAGERAGWQRLLEDHDHADYDHEGSKHDHDCGHDHGEDHDHDCGHDHGHRHPEDVYGVTSFAFVRDRPLHPGRFLSVLESLPSNVIRAKGRCWVAGREAPVQVLNVAGPSVRVEVAGRWIASLPEPQQSLYRDNRPTDRWHPEHGDREVRLVFIGTDLDERALTAALEECLLTDAELETWLEDGTAEPALADDHPFPEQEDEVLVVA